MTTLKTCFKCSVEKPLDGFYKHPMMADGHLGKCKECTMTDVRARRALMSDYYIEYDRVRSQDPARKEQAQASFNRSAKKNPGRVMVNRLVGNAIRDGKVLRQPCWVCGEKAEAHHPDYSQPFDIVWLCTRHHRATHAIMLRADLKR